MSQLIDAQKREVLSIWLRITGRTLTREQAETFLLHAELPRIIRSLELKGSEHVERVGRARMANGTLRLVNWRVGLSAWAAKRHEAQVAAAQAEERADADDDESHADEEELADDDDEFPSLDDLAPEGLRPRDLQELQDSEY